MTIGKGASDEDALAAALVAARPAPAADGAAQLRKQAVLANVLGPHRPAPRVGRWVVESKVGEGGMGMVFRGRDPDSGQPVAIKVLGSEAAQERPRFVREAVALRTIDHPHVVRYLDHGVTDADVDYLVMEWLEGHDLSTHLGRGPMNIAQALTMARTAAQALGAAHAAGIVHRDVKPTNLFLVGGRIDGLRVLDFGIARSSGGAAAPANASARSLTRSGELVGSPRYMAPEQIRGSYDVRTDAYGLGATLFESITGRAPFVVQQRTALLLAIVRQPPPLASSLRKDVPPAVDALLSRMLAKNVDDRPCDMATLDAELEALLR